MYCDRIRLCFFLPSDLRATRARLLELFTDVTCNPEMMKKATDAYFSLLQGQPSLNVNCGGTVRGSRILD